MTLAFSTVNKIGQKVQFVSVFDQICKVPFPVKTGKTPDSTGSIGVAFNPTEAKTEIIYTCDCENHKIYRH